MSEPPENRGQGDPPRHPGGSGGVNGTGGPSRRANVITSLEAQAEELERALSTQARRRNSVKDDTNTEGTESDIKDFIPRLPLQLPETRHENTPEANIDPQLPAADHENVLANVEHGAATNGVRANLDDAQDPYASDIASPHSSQSLGNDRAASTDGNAHGGARNGVNGVGEDGNDAQTPRVPDITTITPSPRSSESSGNDRAGNMNDDGDNDADDESNEGTDNEASSDTGGSPRSPVSRHSRTPPGPDPQPPGSQGGSSGQAGPAGNRNYSSQNQSSGSHPNLSSRAGRAGGSDGDHIDSQGQTRAGGNTLRNQQAREHPWAFDRESNQDDEIAGPASDAHLGSFHPQRHGPSHVDPAFPAYTLLGQTPSTSQLRGSSSSMNPIAPSFVPRQQRPATSQEFTIPRWQPDAEVQFCPICNVQFSMFLRKHHCRKCGRVVCNSCSPHRITIPHPYIVRPPGDPGPVPQHSYPGVERGVADFSAIGGGERVRLCNPCVPDPNTTPPQAQRSSRPVIVDGRSSRARPPSNSLGDYGAGLRPGPLPGYGIVRTRSATTGAGQDELQFIPVPVSFPSLYGYPPRQPPQRHMSGSSRPHYPPPMGHPGGAHGTWSSVPGSGLNRPLPRTPTPEPEIPEEDACPVCHCELPSRHLPLYEDLREAHIDYCITLHSGGSSRTAAATESGSHGTPPPRTTRRTRMFPYVATEKDCANDAECTICLEEFKVGDEMARLECFCRFHRSCIDSWFINRPGRCPVHQHDSFGY
ncbi:hypothetical protein ANO14919_101940 [Xylariales sp. No.14919]|nr:hypothetical protein ANO14919_101940 [Xylariales sp. No.14919]